MEVASIPKCDIKEEKIINPFGLIAYKQKDQSIVKAQRRAIFNLITKHPDHLDREILFSYFHDGMSIEEVSPKLKKSIRSVRAKLLSFNDSWKIKLGHIREDKGLEKIDIVAESNISPSIKIRKLKKLAQKFKRTTETESLASYIDIVISRIKQSYEKPYYPPPDLLGSPCPAPRPKTPPFLNVKLDIPFEPMELNLFFTKI